MIYLILAVLSVVSAIFYRSSGMGMEVKHWIPKWLRQGWVRDWMCPLLCLGALALIHPFILFDKWWLIPISYLIMGASLSTYLDELPFNHGNDNLFLSGFFVGLSLFPLAFVGISFWLILARAVLLALIWGGLNRVVNNNHVEHSDFIEEFSRGATLIMTLIIFI